MKQQKESLKEVIYRDLKEKIIFCEYLPGTPISEEEIGKEYHVSRTPVREAILQLAREDYITIAARKSTRVSKISYQEMNEIIEARLLTEPYILRCQEKPLADDVVERLKVLRAGFEEVSLCDEKSLKQFLKMDYEFHCLLVNLSRNHLLIQFCQDILERSTRQWYLMCIRMEGRLSVAKDEHKQIIDHLVEGDYGNAAKNLEQHIRAFYDLVYFN